MTHCFDSHFNGYVIEPVSPPSYIVVNVKSLKSYPVLHAHKPFNNTSETYIKISLTGPLSPLSHPLTS